MKKQKVNPELLPRYPLAAIYGLAALSKALGVHPNRLLKYASNAENMYRVAKCETKQDGTTRQTFDALPPLKAIQIKIKERILQHTIFPSYLHGSLRGCSPRTNAAVHTNAKITFAEDISKFFPSANSKLVEDVWTRLFGFSTDVASLLTALTTKGGGLPQGAVTSSYLANLVFWKYEPNLVGRFASRGLRYSRYVDDITVSSEKRISANDKTRVIAEIYGMLLHHGLKPNRKKQDIISSAKSMQTTKLVHHSRVSLPSSERQRIRAAVFALESRLVKGEPDASFEKELASVSSRVGRLGSFHKAEAIGLKKRLAKVRLIVMSEQKKNLDHPSVSVVNESIESSANVPWPV
jgi:hypothetical protein